jgi:alanine racemase
MEAFQRATAWVDLGALERNCRRLAAELGPETELCAVVKANGYGHGMAEAARAAIAGGASRLAVATAGEAFELRAALPETPILVMGALTDAELDVALSARAEIGVWQPEFLAVVAERGSTFGLRPAVHVKYDTGMGRLGNADPAVVESLLATAASDERVEAAGLWTHFATADEADGSYLAEQLERFSALAVPARERFGVRLHAANSAATLAESAAHFDMVRCGIAIYGLDPFGTDAEARRLEPVLGLSSYLADIKRFGPGRSAGYGRRWTAERETWVGVVPIGYGDGVPRALTNNCEVLIAGRRYPLVGTVSMDNVTVDLGPDCEAQRGEEVVLLGPSGGERVSVEEWAARTGTINYEIATGISPRVPRVRRG